MNYRHAFHAGNHADVLKHCIVLATLAALKKKPTPVFVLDTHAGRGTYRLDADEATRSGEAADGIGRLGTGRFDSVALQRYVGAIRPWTEGSPPRYPGSPRLILDVLGADDRLACCELHPEEAAALRSALAGDARAAVHQRDGYEAVGALLPPTQSRGLVLIDPPFEQRDAEFGDLLDALRTILKRWAVASIAVWYPLKHSPAVARFLREAAMLPARAAWFAELSVQPSDTPLRMHGSGMLLLNPPYELDLETEAALRELGPLLGQDGQGRWRLHWLRRDGEVVR